MSRARLGSGRRFRWLKAKLRRRGVKNPGALAAHIGMRKYGKRRMLRMAAAGRRRRGRRQTADGRRGTVDGRRRTGEMRR